MWSAALILLLKKFICRGTKTGSTNCYGICYGPLADKSNAFSSFLTEPLADKSNTFPSFLPFLENLNTAVFISFILLTQKSEYGN